MKRVLFLTFVILRGWSEPVIAQPANDDCAFAQLIPIPETGVTCINASNLLATSDGFSNACNAIVSGGNEVWFTFIAPGDLNTVSVYPSAGAGAAQQVSVAFNTGNCSVISSTQCDAAASANDTATISGVFSQGTQVWFEVTTLLADGNFTVCITSANDTLAPGDSCSVATDICNKLPFVSFGPDFINFGSNAIPCYPFGPQNYGWYKFSVGKSGTLEWYIKPLAPYEIDWALFDITSGCQGTVLACNYTTTAGGGAVTGMSSSSITPCGNSGQICQGITVTAGSTYAIQFNVANFLITGVDTPFFTFTWGGTFKMSPHAEFTVDIPSACGSVTTTFSDSSSTIPGTTYFWNFGNGNTANVSNPPSQTYSSPGVYPVTLTVTNPAGCTSTYSQSVTVLQGPTSTFSVNDTTLCINDNVNIIYAGNASGAATYMWNFNGGTIVSGSGQGPYIISWNAAGIYNVTLQVIENACTSAVFSQAVYVSNFPSSSFTVNASACTGDTLIVTYTGTAGVGATYNWNFGTAIIVSGSGQGPYQIYYSIAGNYQITLDIIENGCASIQTIQNISIGNKPTASFIMPAQACEGVDIVIIYTGTVSGTATYTWNFSGGNITSGTGQGPYSVNWTAAGNYPVTVSVTDNGCTSPLFSDTISVFATPASAFTIVPGALCTGQNATVTYTGNAGAGAVYNWNFNGANIVSGSGAGPYVINFSTAGNYTLSLDVLENGCVSPVTNNSIAVTDQPVASFIMPQQGCQGANVNIAFTGNAVAGSVFSWNFSGATIVSGSGQGPYTVSWNSAGQQIVSLSINTSGCISNIFSDTILITATPTSAFAINPPFICGPPYAATITYAGNGSATATYTWSFGSGTITSGSGQGPYVINWNNPGTEYLSLTVSENGCVSTITNDSIIIGTTPVADAGSDISICSLDSLTPIGTAGISGITYQWQPAFGLVSPSSSQTNVMVANTSAVDTIISYILTATSGNCSDKDTVQVTIKPTQIASITVNDAIQCFNAQDFDFNIGSALVPGAVFNWNFGPNATPASSNISNPANITYSSTGTFTVYLSASANGCAVTSDSLPITVSPIPVPSISADVVQGCSPLTVQFIDSTNMSQPGFTFNWNFGTAGTATGPAPLITFSQGGVYDVSLTVTNAAGCDSAIMIPALITVLQTPQASLTATPTVTTIVDPTIVFNNLSSSFDSCLIHYGDGTFSGNCEGPHVYADTGTYLVTLYLYNGNGCTDSIQLTVYVKPFFTFYAPNAFTPNGDGKNDFFLTYSEGVKEFSMIIYGRNGVPVFKADNIYEAWYGKYNDTSDPVQDGVYVYRAAVTDVFNKKHVYYGRVSVIR